jgi:dihydropteroate synthase
MGVVNASPESFSDGGRYPDLLSQVRAGVALMADGAQLVDVGGESGVTGSDPLSAAEERGRVEPLVRALVAEGIPVSVDTWKAEVAAAVLDAGALLINDVSGLGDPSLAALCARADAGLVIMHTRARPKHKDFPFTSVGEAVRDVPSFLAEKIAVAESQGLMRSRIIVDPGPDFGKTPAQTVAVLAALADLDVLDCPILLAVSRKDFVGALTGRRPLDRLAGTLAAVADGLARGASILRVHDVAAVRDYLLVARALSGEDEVPESLRIDTHLRRQSEPAEATDGPRTVR